MCLATELTGRCVCDQSALIRAVVCSISGLRILEYCSFIDINMLLGMSAYNSSSSDEEEKPVKKERKKISIPKPNNYASSDEDEPSAKRANLDADGKKTTSGLFSKLPPPRNTVGSGKQANRPLIPYVFTKKTDSSTKPAAKLKNKGAVENDADSSDNDDSVSFFSFVDKETEKSDASKSIPEPVVTSKLPSVPAVDSSFIEESKPPPSQLSAPTSHQDSPSQPVNSYQQPPNPPLSESSSWHLDERFQRIQGKGNRREKIEFIDVNADSALEGNKELLLQQISEEKNLNRTSHSKKNSNQPSSQSKKKHQMSYLIHQAKEREIELKNAWAAGHAARQAARNRYGF